MKKVSELDFYPFVELWKILREKFTQYYFKYVTDDVSDRHILISAVRDNDTEETECMLEIVDPMSYIDEKEMNRLDANESIKFLTIRLFFHSWESIHLKVEQKNFDDENFVQILKSLIGKIAPIRPNTPNEEWHEEMEKWVKQLIIDSGIKKYSVSIERLEESFI